MSVNQKSTALFIGGLLETTTPEMLTNYFSQFGEIKGVNLIIDWVTGKSKRCAIVSCQESITVEKIMSSNPHCIEGKHVRVDVADENRRGTKIVRTTKIYLGHIPAAVTNEELFAHFLNFGDIRHLKIIRNFENGANSNGYLEFYKVCSAQNLLKERHNVCIRGHKIFCQPFKAKTVQEGQFLKMISNFDSQRLEHCLKIYFQMQVGSMSKAEQREFFHSFGPILYNPDLGKEGNKGKIERDYKQSQNLREQFNFGNQELNQKYGYFHPDSGIRNEQIPNFGGWGQFQGVSYGWQVNGKDPQVEAKSNFHLEAEFFSMEMARNNCQNGIGTHRYREANENNNHLQNVLNPYNNNHSNSNEFYRFPNLNNNECFDSYQSQNNFHNGEEKFRNFGFNIAQNNHNLANQSLMNWNMLNTPLSKNILNRRENENQNSGFSKRSSGSEFSLFNDLKTLNSPLKPKNTLLRSFTATTGSRLSSSSEEDPERKSNSIKLETLQWFDLSNSSEENNKRKDNSEEDLYEEELLREATNVSASLDWENKMNC